MKLPNKILEKLSEKQQNLMAPSNLFEMGLKELNALGYKILDNSLDIQNGDLMAATTKNLNLWILIDDAKYIKKFIKNNLILRKH